MKRSRPSVWFSLWLGAVAIGCAAAGGLRAESPSIELRPEAITAHVRQGFARLEERYWSATLSIWLDRPGDDLRAHFEGRRNPPWWPSANAIEGLIDFMDATGSAEYQQSVESLYELQKDHSARQGRLIAELKRRSQWNARDEERWQKQVSSAKPRSEGGHYSDFQNEYLDDSGWWGVTWLKMYDRTGSARYLKTAQTIHAHMAGNWMPDKGGGVIWCEDDGKQKPNAITNSLFLILSARLYQRTGEAPYLEWAEKTVAWFRATRLFDGTAIVDGPGHEGDYWTYNQGAYLGGLTALHLATGRREYLDEAASIAGAVLSRANLVLPNGVIVERIGTGGDATLFKGIFVRYLGQLNLTLKAAGAHAGTAEAIDGCLRGSVASMLRHGVAPDGFFTAEWHEGAANRASDFNTQVSALLAMIALVQK